MQDKKLESVLFTVPAELLLEADIFDGDLLRMYVDNGRIIIEPVKEDMKNIVCGGDCENCSLGQMECDEDCRNCPCSCDEREVE